jgi:hypothetical protein
MQRAEIELPTIRHDSKSIKNKKNVNKVQPETFVFFSCSAIFSASASALTILSA